MDIILHYFQPESCDIHLNHADLLDAIWTWAGIRPEHRQKVAEVLNRSAISSCVVIVSLNSFWSMYWSLVPILKLLSLLGSLRPQSSERKTKWVVIRRQLRQVWVKFLNVNLQVINIVTEHCFVIRCWNSLCLRHYFFEKWDTWERISESIVWLFLQAIGLFYDVPIVCYIVRCSGLHACYTAVFNKLK